MQIEGLPSLTREVLIEHLLHACSRYFGGHNSILKGLPVKECTFPEVSGPLKLAEVELPVWGEKWGCDGILAVPRECCVDPDAPHWEQVDWWLAAFLMLEGWHERAWEQKNGPIHSYAFRLDGWDARVWDRAWVNRIALFLRAWAAQLENVEETLMFGPLPKPELLLTHDVDAIEKTLAIRLKQTMFLTLNVLRLLFRGQLAEAGNRMCRVWRFLFLSEDWWLFDEMCEMERHAGLRSHFNFYADERPRTLQRWLFDPGYDVTQPRIAAKLKELIRTGWGVGLHQSYDAWTESELIRQQKVRLEAILPVTVSSCRQHWLRFSWQKTWSAQAKAGFSQDTTMMFNDRPGFRVAAALQWAPWDVDEEKASNLNALPTVLMDSHFYDYQPMDSDERHAALKRWLSEIVAIGGQAAVLWHPHTISSDYGWREGFQDLLDELKGVVAC